MRIVAVAALLVVLAGSGIAGAATMTLSYVTGPTTIYKTADDPNTPEIENRPTKTTFSVYAAVTANSYIVTSAPAMTFYGGVNKFEVNVVTSSSLGQVTPTASANPLVAATTINTNNFISVAMSNGSIVDSSGNPTAGGVGGIVGNGTTAQSVAGSMASNTGNTTAWRATPMTASQLQYWWGNTASSYGDGAGPDIDYNVPVLLFSGELNAVKVGNVTVNLNLTTTSTNTKVWGVSSLTTGALSIVTPTKVNTSFGLIVGADAILVDNIAPEVSILGGDVLEGEWSKEPNWNNPLHSVEITAVGTDDGKPNPPGTLTYEWIMHKPGGVTKVLADTDAVLQLTLAQIASMGLPPYVGVDDPSYHWGLSVTAFDGGKYSAPAEIGVFVPEPATIGLLGFGVVGALLRRRRRA